MSGKYEFTIAVDPNGTKSAPVTGYFLLKKQPNITILPDKLREIITVAPSNIELEHEIPLYIIAVDKYLNPIKSEEGEFKVKYGLKMKVYHSRNGMITLDPIHIVDSNKKYAIYEVDQSEKKGISSKTNPIKFGEYINKENLYWGDINDYTKYSDSMGLPNEVITYARDIARLDFATITDHDDIGPYLSDKEWKDTEKVIEKFN